MKRRRGRPSKGGDSPTSRKRGARSNDPALRRRAILILVIAGAGLGGGYLFATQVLFPSPEAGPGFHQVPDLQGLTAQEASSALSDMGLELGLVDSMRHPDVEEGRVVGQSPLPGQLSVPGGEIRLTVSLGPETRPVPEVEGLRADRARTILEGSGFTVAVDSVESNLPRGRVLALSPDAGSSVTLPEEVTLDVSLGPPLVDMPDLLGLDRDEALAILDSLGLVVGEVEARSQSGPANGEVVEQDPEADVEVELGTAVRLVVGG